MPVLACAAAVVLSVHQIPTDDPSKHPTGWWDHPELSGLQLNQIQVIGTHNSYKAEVQPELLRGIASTRPDAALSIDYRHLPLDEQLDLGIRNLELDVYWDPEGGHYTDPLGNRMLESLGGVPWPYNTDGELNTPGLKVMHECDFDFRSHTLRFEDTLAGLAYWSAMHPGHLPVIVTMNLKQGDAPVDAATDPFEWDATALRALDDDFRTHLGEHNLLVPDQIRGPHASLADAIKSDGWPSVDACRGKFIVLLDHHGNLASDYLDLHPGLNGATIFTIWPPESPDTVFRVINDPMRSADAIRQALERRQFVRTRADAGTHEMRAGDFSRFEAAQASGAQVITTDYPVPDTRHNAEYRVEFAPGVFARPNPVTGAALGED